MPPLFSLPPPFFHILSWQLLFVHRGLLCTHICLHSWDLSIKPSKTPLYEQHTCTTSELSASPTHPPSQKPCGANYMDPDRTGWSLTKSVCVCVKVSLCMCVCMCKWQFDDSAGFPAFYGEILSKGTTTQSALCIQHSRSMTCQLGLWITVMDVLINATVHTRAHSHSQTELCYRISFLLCFPLVLYFVFCVALSFSLLLSPLWNRGMYESGKRWQAGDKRQEEYKYPGGKRYIWRGDGKNSQ